MNELINDYNEVKDCTYKDEYYSVRDNGAIYRHSKNPNKPRKHDNYWTFGYKHKKNGYMYLGQHRIHIIVAIAFYGIQDSKKYVVDHKDTNRCNNRIENLRWCTKMENALSNPVTLKKLTYLCSGNIQKFLDDPSCIRDIAGSNQDIAWMRTVSKEEAQAAYRNVMKWSNEKSRINNGNISKKGQIGEWIYTNNPYNNSTYKLTGNYQEYINREMKDNNIDGEEILTQSLTKNARQKNWKTPTIFPLCPQVISDNPLQMYYNNIKKDFVVSENYHSKSTVLDFAIHNNSLFIITKIYDNDIKPYGLITVTYENNVFIHSGTTFFEKRGAEKAMILAQGLEWNGGDGIDDYC